LVKAHAPCSPTPSTAWTGTRLSSGWTALGSRSLPGDIGCCLCLSSRRHGKQVAKQVRSARFLTLAHAVQPTVSANCPETAPPPLPRRRASPPRTAVGRPAQPRRFPPPSAGPRLRRCARFARESPQRTLCSNSTRCWWWVQTSAQTSARNTTARLARREVGLRERGGVPHCCFSVVCACVEVHIGCKWLRPRGSVRCATLLLAVPPCRAASCPRLPHRAKRRASRRTKMKRKNLLPRHLPHPASF
jgi:hypothetical protein